MFDVVFVLTYRPNEEHIELTPIDNFNTVLGVFNTYDQAMDCIKENMEADEKFEDFDLYKGEFDYFMTNYGTYRILKTAMRVL